MMRVAPLLFDTESMRPCLNPPLLENVKSRQVPIASFPIRGTAYSLVPASSAKVSYTEVSSWFESRQRLNEYGVKPRGIDEVIDSVWSKLVAPLTEETPRDAVLLRHEFGMPPDAALTRQLPLRSAKDPKNVFISISVLFLLTDNCVTCRQECANKTS